MKKKIILVLSFDELIKRAVEEQDLSDNYTSVVDKEKGTITITDENEVDLPDLMILMEQSSERATIADKIFSSLKSKPKEELKIEDLSNATPDLKSLSKSEKPRLARLKNFYKKYSENKIEDILRLKFSEVKEALGYNQYGIPSHQLLVAIF